MSRIANFKLYDETITPFGQTYDYDLNYLITAIENLSKNNLEQKVDIQLIKKAFDISYQVHSGYRLASMVPYYVRPLSIALILIEELQICEQNIIIAAILYDLYKYGDNSYSKDVIIDEFGETVFLLIEGITRIAALNDYTHTNKNKNKNDNNDNVDKKHIEIYRKLFLLMVKEDIRVFIINLSERIYIMRTLQYFPKYYQVAVAQETLNFYTPLLHRIGLTSIKNELESRAFYFYNYSQYKQIQNFLTVRKKIFTEYYYSIIDNIKTYLNQNNISHNIKLTHKQEYEIFLLIQEGKKLEEIDNIFSINIVLDTDNTQQCYDVYKLLEKKIDSLQFADLSSNLQVIPKTLLTIDLFVPNNKIQISITTKAVDEHSIEKTIQNLTEKSLLFQKFEIADKDIELWENWMEHIINTKETQEASLILWNSIRSNIFNESITVFTRSNEKITLPKGSTGVDLAFNLSNEIGLHAITCKINGYIKSLFTELANNDKVEIITSPKCNPDSSWLNHIVTFKAAAHLSNYFKANCTLKLNISSNTNKQPKYQSFRISGINNNDKMLSRITKTIGQDNIRRVALAPNMNTFEAAIQTFFLDDEIKNELFIKLININGVKSVNLR